MVKETTTTEEATTTTKAFKKNTLPDPCTLLTIDDGQQLAGTALTPGVTAGTQDDMSCTYAGDPNGPTAQVEFFVGDGAKKSLDVDQSLGHTITPVPDVGDEAYIEDFNLFFRTGTRWNQIRLTLLEDFPAYQQPMIDLGKKIAAEG